MMIFTRRLGAFDHGRVGVPADAARADAKPAGEASADHAPAVVGMLRLTYDWRQKSRCRVHVSEAASSGQPSGVRAGMEVGLDLPRGAVLRDGDRIATEDGLVLRVHAAVEQLLQVRAADALSLTRIAYHLGNRHVPVQIGADAQAGWLRLQLDHVLENMVVGLGGTIQVLSAPFDPEVGAYGSFAAHGDGGHAHAHEGGRGHGRVSAAASRALDDPRQLADRRHAPRIHDFIDSSP